VYDVTKMTASVQYKNTSPDVVFYDCQHQLLNSGPDMINVAPRRQRQNFTAVFVHMAMLQQKRIIGYCE
jgi:hypothetical protein